jgi:hypothetical protein
VLICCCRGTVLGEYFNDIPLEEYSTLRGVYRIKVASSATDAEITRCVMFNATAEMMRDILFQDIALVRRRGGVTVRRSGDGGANFNFGYRYRVEFDAPQTDSYELPPLLLSLHCTGIDNCGCAQTKIPLVDQFGLQTCYRSGNISRTNPASCVLPPSIIFSRLSTMGYTKTSGLGKIVVSGGLHRMPPISNLDIGCAGGGATVAADVVSWKGITATGNGTVMLAGTGWHGWDSSVLLYQGPEAEGRGLRRLNAAPACLMRAQNFAIADIGRVLTAGPESNLTWTRGQWMGGIIGGRSTVFIEESILAAGAGKALKFGVTLFVTDTAVFEWVEGNISLSNGADIIVEGIFEISVTFGRAYIGQAQLLSMPPNAPYQGLLVTVPDVNFNGYFDDSVAAELRTAWYMNPACGAQCAADSQIILRANAHLIAHNNSNATFVSPLNLRGYSTFELGVDGLVDLNAGGDCGNFVVMQVSDRAQVTLSGGNFGMQATCTITGSGELLVVNGTHNLCFSIDAHITISGGQMIWPQSRGAKSTLRFFGGLLIEGTGQLLVEPLETSIIVDKVVEFKDQCLVQFPMIGISAQPSLYDTVDAPDISPRGSLTATNIMRFGGGTLRGKADFNVGSVLYLEGEEKRIRSLAKLVNRGHAEWSSGDIITADQGDFVNLGSVQMANGTELFNANMRAQGTIIPVESGGDAFALEYHSWDLDQGNLDFQGTLYFWGTLKR